MIISRRKFLAKVGSRILPILAMVGGVALTVNATTPPRGCKNGCKATCKGLCAVGCTYGCRGTCDISCKGTCQGSCKNSCRHSEKNTADSAITVTDTIINKIDSIK